MKNYSPILAATLLSAILFSCSKEHKTELIYTIVDAYTSEPLAGVSVSGTYSKAGQITGSFNFTTSASGEVTFTWDESNFEGFSVTNVSKSGYQWMFNFPHQEISYGEVNRQTVPMRKTDAFVSINFQNVFPVVDSIYLKYGTEYTKSITFGGEMFSCNPFPVVLPGMGQKIVTFPFISTEMVHISWNDKEYGIYAFRDSAFLATGDTVKFDVHL